LNPRKLLALARSHRDRFTPAHSRVLFYIIIGAAAAATGVLIWRAMVSESALLK